MNASLEEEHLNASPKEEHLNASLKEEDLNESLKDEHMNASLKEQQLKALLKEQLLNASLKEEHLKALLTFRNSVLQMEYVDAQNTCEATIISYPGRSTQLIVQRNFCSCFYLIMCNVYKSDM